LRAAGLAMTVPRRAVYQVLVGRDRPVSASGLLQLGTKWYALDPDGVEIDND
jgi:Fe2+ or Zn2+ uptake regulation protein